MKDGIKLRYFRTGVSVLFVTSALWVGLCPFLFGQEQGTKKETTAVATPAAGTAKDDEAAGAGEKPAPSAFDVFRYAIRNAKLKEAKRPGEAEVEPPEYFGLGVFTDADSTKQKMLEKFLPKVITQTSDGTKFQQHIDVVTSLCLCPDGQTIVSGSADKEAKLWNIVDRKKTVRTYKDEFNHKLGITDVAVSPDGSHILTASYDNSIRLWNVKTGKNTKAFLGLQDRVWSVAVAPTGQWVAGASDEGNILVWDPRTMKKAGLLSGTAGPIYDLQFSYDGQYLLSSGADMIIRLWDMTTGRQVQAFTGHTDRVYSAVFAPNGNFVLSASRDKTARIWNTYTGEELCRFVGHTGAVRRAVFIAPAPPRVPAARGGVNRSGRAEEMQQQNVRSNIFVATASDDGTVRIWLPNMQRPKKQNTNGQEGMEGGDPGMAGGMADPSGMGMNMTSQTGKRVFTTPSDEEFEEEEKPADGSKPKSKKKKVKPSTRPVSKNKGIQLCNISTPGKIAIFDLVATPDSTRLIGAGADGIVRIWGVPDVTAELRKMKIPKNLSGMGGMEADPMGGMMQ